MNILDIFQTHELVLAEASIVESLRRSEQVQLHPDLEHALLIYEAVGKDALLKLYNGYVAIAQRENIPILLSSPTWRANRERIESAGISSDVNADAVKFLCSLRSQWGSWSDMIGIGGLIGCKNDAYGADGGLSITDAIDFHAWQIERLVDAGVDFLLAATLPARPEAVGIALAMEQTGIPYFISFVIDRNGRILDGSFLEEAIAEIDSRCQKPPLGFMINCAYPGFLDPRSQPDTVVSRLVGYQANASSQDHSELDCSDSLQADDIDDWGSRMIQLNRQYGLKILGGCCGTGPEHLEYIVRNIGTLSS